MARYYNKIPENLRKYANRATNKWRFSNDAWNENWDHKKDIQKRHMRGKVARGFPAGCGWKYSWWRPTQTKFGPGEKDKKVIKELKRLTEEYQRSLEGRPMKKPAPGCPAWSHKEGDDTEQDGR